MSQNVDYMKICRAVDIYVQALLYAAIEQAPSEEVVEEEVVQRYLAR
jgi:hypothetical protein